MIIKTLLSHDERKEVFKDKESYKDCKMPFSNVPVKNPGRYFEKFVKIVQPMGGEVGQAQAGHFSNKRSVLV